MCRLFGLSAGSQRIHATFWLLDAPDSLTVQSRAEPDGAGIGAFANDGTPVVYRTPFAAYEDARFASEARELESTTFVAHVRYASTGAVATRNTHPFEQEGRLFAHNGVVGDLAKLEGALGSYRSLVHGDTDSERVFALITRETHRAGGDITAGITNAARWVAEELPLYALNLILTTPDGLWALRYPETHDLFVLERPAGGAHGHRYFDGTGLAGRMRVRSAQLAEARSVIFASEPLDEHPGWRNLDPGELVHVDAALRIETSIALAQPPPRLLRLQDLDARTAASQHPASPAGQRVSRA